MSVIKIENNRISVFVHDNHFRIQNRKRDEGQGQVENGGKEKMQAAIVYL